MSCLIPGLIPGLIPSLIPGLIPGGFMADDWLHIRYIGWVGHTHRDNPFQLNKALRGSRLDEDWSL
ncbi:MAG: hypothetical protein ACPH9S_05640, partial [Candidatus Puniceispirillaceae bacterium]